MNSKSPENDYGTFDLKIILGNRLVDAVLEDPFTRPELGDDQVEVCGNLCRMAEAFVEATAGPKHISQLANGLADYTDMEKSAAKEQAQHAFEIMKNMLSEMTLH